MKTNDKVMTSLFTQPIPLSSPGIMFTGLRRMAQALFRWLTAAPALDRNIEREALFNRIMAENQPMIRRICFSYAHSREDYEDLRQDILINIWNGLFGFRSDSSFSTWIYRVALNTCVSTLRARKKDPRKIAIQELVEDIVADSEDSELKENLARLHECISMLSPVDKAIITMRLDECSYEEISKVVGLTVSNVAVRINRIKKKIALQINQE